MSRLTSAATCPLMAPPGSSSSSSQASPTRSRSMKTLGCESRLEMWAGSSMAKPCGVANQRRPSGVLQALGWLPL